MQKSPLADRIKFASSFLFTPALTKFNFDKGHECGADVTVLDLEDSIAIPEKSNARSNVLNFFQTRPPFISAIRINSIRLNEGQRDLLLLAEMANLPDIIFLPKVQADEEILIIEDTIRSTNEKVPLLIAIIENALGLANIAQIAKVSSGLIFGSADYSADVELDMNWQNLLHVRRKIADIAAAHNIISIDTAYFDVHDQHGLFKECFRLKKIGFHAKAAIHISQIEPINKVFAPRQREIIQAQQIIKKYKETSGGAILLETSMIGPPFVILAQKILNRAKFRGLL